MRHAFVLFAALTLPFLASCGRGFVLVDDVALSLDATLPAGATDLDPGAAATLRATFQIEGLLAETDLVIADGVATGDFTLNVPQSATHTGELRLYGALNVERAPVLLAVSDVSLSLTPGEIVDSQLDAAAWSTDAVADGRPLDANKNERDNLADLAVGCDPAPAREYLTLSTRDVQFPSGLSAGESSRQLVVLTNTHERAVSVRVDVVDALGVGVSRVAVGDGDDGGGLPRPSDVPLPSIEVPTMAPGAEVLIGLTFSPATEFLSTGLVALRVDEEPFAAGGCGNAQGDAIFVIGNADAPLQSPPTGSEPFTAVAAGADLGGFAPADVQVFPLDNVWGGVAKEVTPEDGASTQAVGEFPADVVWVVELPAGAALATTMAKASVDVNLTVLRLGAGDDADTEAPLFAAPLPGGSPEWATVGPFADEARLLLVAGRPAPEPGFETERALDVYSVTAHVVPPMRVLGGPTPTLVDALGGTVVTIPGQHFAASPTPVRVLFDDVEGTGVTVAADGASLSVEAPSADLSIVDNPTTLRIVAGEPGAELALTLPRAVAWLPAPPSVSGVTPAQLPETGGTPVTVTGARFTDAYGLPRVFFGGAQATGVQWVSSTQLRALAPAGTAGFADVVVENEVPTGQSARTGTLPNGVQYLVSQGAAPTATTLDPDSGPIGGTTVTIRGSGFVDPMDVLFGGVPSPDVRVVSGTEITALAPAVSAAVNNVVVAVRNPADQQFAVADERFSYFVPVEPAPALIAVTPASGSQAGGTSVMVQGANFVDGAIVIFGGALASTTFVDANRLDAVAPASPLAGAVDVSVRNPDAQTGTLTSAFSYEPAPPAPPEIVGVSPQQLHALVPGDELTLLGTGLSGALDAATLEDGSASYATSVLGQTDSAVRVRVDDALPAGSYVARLSFDGGTRTVDSPSLSASAPQLFSVEVIAGSALENSAFSLLLTGFMLNPDHLSGVVFDDGTTQVTLVPVFANESAVQVDVVAGDVVQTDYAISLAYDNGGASAPAPQTLTVDGDCGNDVVENLEDCEPAVFTDTCADRGFVGGVLNCTASCRWDTSQCHTCGDGTRDPGETCDGDDLGSADCVTQGFDKGVLACDDACTFDVTMCSKCGNGVREFEEQCDVNMLPGDPTCSALGFTAGTVTCGDDCAFDASGCYECGDGVCALQEDNASCPSDCPVTCGDGMCMGGETCNTCPTDCQLCAPYQLNLIGDQQAAYVTDVLPDPLIVEVLDDAGDPVPGVNVTLAPDPGVYLSTRSGTTDVNGRLSTTVRLGLDVGPDYVQVTALAPDGTSITGAPGLATFDAQDVPDGWIITPVNVNTGTTFNFVEGMPATQLHVSTPRGVAFDDDGNLYVAVYAHHQIYRISPQGSAHLVAGSGTGAAGFAGDGSQATDPIVRIQYPMGVDLDSRGRVYFSSITNDRIRMVDEGGVLQTWTGGGPDTANDGDGEPRLNGHLTDPWNVAVDRETDDVYILELRPNAPRVRKVDGTTEILSTRFHPVTYGCERGGSASIGAMNGLGVASGGRVLLSASTGSRAPSCAGGFGAVTALFSRGPSGVRLLHDTGGLGLNIAVGPTDRIYTGNWQDRRVWVLDELGRRVRIAGTGGWGTSTTIGPASGALFKNPDYVALSKSGDLAISDLTNQFVRIVRGAERMSVPDIALALESGDSQTATIGRQAPAPLRALLTDDGNPSPDRYLHFTAIDPGGRVTPFPALTDASGVGDGVAWVGLTPGDYRFTARPWDAFQTPYDEHEVSFTVTAERPADGTVLLVANESGATAPSGGQPLPRPASTLVATFHATQEELNATIGPDGAYYVPEKLQHRVLRLTMSGMVERVAGTGTAGYTGDGGAATSARLSSPSAVVFDSAGNLYIADEGNNVVRRVDVDGDIDTYAGGAADTVDHGDGLQAAAANLSQPSALAVDSADNLIIGEQGRCRIRQVDPNTEIITSRYVSYNDTCSGICTSSQRRINTIYSLAVDDDDRLYLGGYISGDSGCPGCGSDCGNWAVYRESGAGWAPIGERIGGDTQVSIAHDPSDNSIVYSRQHTLRRYDITNGTNAYITGTFWSQGLSAVDTVPSALLVYPKAVAVNAQGDVFFTHGSTRIRMIVDPP
jgi:hypothetical protein